MVSHVKASGNNGEEAMETASAFVPEDHFLLNAL
ncbi:hypothetical protein SAMN05216555_10998 [Arthrobacter cupressi]|uniref:Uncharacterized protein n=1 Tax=Arthrobacter cupressi TaxID=1045773 RepID=A0A1G8SR16_9MICC|nr:hypothetical protein [Arthrobacter cupressi]SDJ31686.1 hypothetical protein SAMN05216555_10998 [Arthrobacter cupressi]